MLKVNDTSSPTLVGFLLLLMPLDSDCEICSAINHPFICPVCPDYCWLMGNGIPVYQKGKRQGADADTAPVPS